MRLLPAVTLAASLLIVGCSTVPLPDGSKVARLPEPAVPAVLSAEERKRYDEIDKQVLREQQTVRESEQRAQAEVRRHVHPHWNIYYGYGWPYWGWGWYGPGRWHPRAHWGPRWGVDLYVWP
jgi:hypothetical protein